MILPRIRRRGVLALFAFSSLFLGAVRAEQKCPALAIHDAPKAKNIFNVQQEMELGDIEAELLEGSYQVVSDAALAEHVTTINNRLLASFPAIKPNIRIILIETPEADAFSVGTSRIYLTRKMIALLRNDDELAGLLGHELGHMVTHQNAIVVSEAFDEMLGVSTGGDRRDIADRFNRMLNSNGWNTATFQNSVRRIQREEEVRQYDADRFALYVMASGGFSPLAYAELFDRLAATHGKRGNLLTDLFGRTTPNQRRLREIYRDLHSLPNSCREFPAHRPSPEFLAWQAEVSNWSNSTFPKRGSK